VYIESGLQQTPKDISYKYPYTPYQSSCYQNIINSGNSVSIQVL